MRVQRCNPISHGFSEDLRQHAVRFLIKSQPRLVVLWYRGAVKLLNSYVMSLVRKWCGHSELREWSALYLGIYYFLVPLEASRLGEVVQVVEFTLRLRRDTALTTFIDYIQRHHRQLLAVNPTHRGLVRDLLELGLLNEVVKLAA